MWMSKSTAKKFSPAWTNSRRTKWPRPKRGRVALEGIIKFWLGHAKKSVTLVTDNWLGSTHVSVIVDQGEGHFILNVGEGLRKPLLAKQPAICEPTPKRVIGKVGSPTNRFFVSFSVSNA